MSCPSNHKTDNQTERPLLQEEFIVCGRCGRDVVFKTMYYIYFGLPLSEQDKKSKTNFSERKSRGEGVDLFRSE